MMAEMCGCTLQHCQKLKKRAFSINIPVENHGVSSSQAFITTRMNVSFHIHQEHIMAACCRVCYVTESCSLVTM